MKNYQKILDLKNVLESASPDMSKIAGGVGSPAVLPMSINLDEYKKYEGDIHIFDNVIPQTNIIFLKHFFENIGTYAPVSVQGMGDIETTGIGSNRITAFMPFMAQYISEKLIDMHEFILHANDYTPTDWYQGDMGNLWEFTGISPMLRFMKYTKGGKHYPHYDAGYLYPSPYSDYRTLYSFVFYLTTNNSGATRFIRDGQENTKIQERNHDDWTREANEDEVFFKSLPKAGRVVIFPHRLCHDVQEFTDDNSERIIIRGDILFKLKK